MQFVQASNTALKILGFREGYLILQRQVEQARTRGVFKTVFVSWHRSVKVHT